MITVVQGDDLPRTSVANLINRRSYEPMLVRMILLLSAVGITLEMYFNIGPGEEF